MSCSHHNNWLSKSQNQWFAVNDNVMGGLSHGQALSQEHGAGLSFEGALSLENNGGFASIRTLVETDCFKQAKKLKLQIQGDGRRYQFRLRDSLEANAVAHVAEIKTQPEQSLVVELTPEDFIAKHRGKVIEDIEPINFSHIIQLGFLLGDKNQQPFKLDVNAIEIIH